MQFNYFQTPHTGKPSYGWKISSPDPRYSCTQAYLAVVKGCYRRCARVWVEKSQCVTEQKDEGKPVTYSFVLVLFLFFLYFSFSQLGSPCNKSSKKDQPHLVLPQVNQRLTRYSYHIFLPTLWFLFKITSSFQDIRQPYIETHVSSLMVYIWFRTEIFQLFIAWIIFQHGLTVIYSFATSKVTA